MMLKLTLFAMAIFASSAIQLDPKFNVHYDGKTKDFCDDENIKCVEEEACGAETSCETSYQCIAKDFTSNLKMRLCEGVDAMNAGKMGMFRENARYLAEAKVGLSGVDNVKTTENWNDDCIKAKKVKVLTSNLSEWCDDEFMPSDKISCGNKAIKISEDFEKLEWDIATVTEQTDKCHKKKTVSEPGKLVEAWAKIAKAWDLTCAEVKPEWCN
mmetsp:Transcript_109509/g.353406  ORF Transcript_109509/g.353406 Transcript_109509/m.353406 type:complete len:213 (+) Transcript_109509:86-724(+)